MRFERLKVRGLGPFRETVDIDLTAIGGPLVAVTGENGAGKSTLLELLAGALYRTCPTRGKLATLATTRDAFVEVRAVNSAPYTVRLTLDAISGKTEAVVLDAAGAAVLGSAKVREYDDWAGKHWPEPAVLYSSAFAVQGRRGFLDLTPAERKQVLVRVLGLERFEVMADSAREHAKTWRGKVDEASARLRELAAVDMMQLGRDLEAAVQRVEETRAGVDTARTALDRARAAAADAERARELAEQRRAAERRLLPVQEQIKDLQSRIANNRGLLARADEIRAAVAKSEESARALRDAQSALQAAKMARAEADSTLRAAQRAVQEAATAVQAAAGRRERALARLKDKAAVVQAAADVGAFAPREEQAAKAIRALEEEIVELERLQLNGKDRRIVGLRGALTRIADRAVTPHTEAANTLQADDSEAQRQAAAPDELKAKRVELVQQRRGLDALRTDRAQAERLAARLPQIEQAEVDLAAADAELEEAGAKRTAAADAVDKARAALDEAAGVEARRAAQCSEHDRALEAVADLVKTAENLLRAEARIAELEPQLTAARAQGAALQAELDAFPAPPEAGSGSTHREQAALDQADRAAADALEQKARLEKALEDAEVAVARREALDRELAAARSEHEDWVRLGQDLGRDGLQALEIDASVPELNTLANDLLSNCHGSRFTVQLSTQRASADGARLMEGLDVKVIDTHENRGREGLADTYSGGEQVIVGEAISLALSMLACQRAGVERPTLVRDESGAALSAANGPAYIAMLRRAAKLLGADRVLYVTHTPALQEMADGRINVSMDGTVEVS